MSDWSNNNLAHVHTWMCLRVLNELPSNTTFDVAGKLRMNELAFWSDLDSPAQRSIKANAMSAQMDNFFRLIQGAQYEVDVDRAMAVQAMAEVLQDATKALKKLARSADDGYRFRNETPQ
jgi:uncharacterized protein (DUF2267 family)